MESDNSNHIYDGIDPDNPEQRPPPERQHVSWKARQLVADYVEISKMSEADKRRYAGGASR